MDTGRLIFRPLTMDDSKDFFELNADPEVVKYLGINPMTELQQAIERVQLVLEQYEKYGIGRYAIIEKETSEFIGFGGLKYFEHAAEGYDGIYDVGYVFKKNHWGKGYASETAKTWIRFGLFEKCLNEIFGMTDPENSRSKQILLNAGMHYVEEIIFEEMPTSLFVIKNPAL